MRIRNTILFFLNKYFSSFKSIHFFVQKLYILLLIPFVRFYLKSRHPQLVQVVFRNSLSSLTEFNAFLSDIDITLVIKDQMNYENIILDYMKLKKIFIMLDQPEIYSAKEFKHLHELSLSKEWDLVNFFWNFRKINWSYKELEEATDPLTKLKKQRAIIKSFKKIMPIGNIRIDMNYHVEDFPDLMNYIPHVCDGKEVCYYSHYLETHRGKYLKLMCTTEQFYFLHSLIPGEIGVKNKFTEKASRAQKVAEFHEYYLTQSAMRLRRTLLKDVTTWEVWNDQLQKKLGIEI